MNENCSWLVTLFTIELYEEGSSWLIARYSSAPKQWSRPREASVNWKSARYLYKAVRINKIHSNVDIDALQRYGVLISDTYEKRVDINYTRRKYGWVCTGQYFFQRYLIFVWEFQTPVANGGRWRCEFLAGKSKYLLACSVMWWWDSFENALVSSGRNQTQISRVKIFYSIKIIKTLIRYYSFQNHEVYIRKEGEEEERKTNLQRLQRSEE